MLTGIECLLTVRPSSHDTPPPPFVTTCPKPKEREHYFTVKQTRSELGYVYWVLQGFGCFRSFTLFDTWSEAMTEANARVALKHAQQELVTSDVGLVVR